MIDFFLNKYKKEGCSPDTHLLFPSQIQGKITILLNFFKNPREVFL